MPFSLVPNKSRFRISNNSKHSTNEHARRVARPALPDPTGVKLVEDLVPLIVELGRWSTKDLLNLSRVSPTWLFPVRQRLYPFIRCTTSQRLGLLARSFSLNPSLASHLHHFYLDIWSMGGMTDKRLIKMLEILFSHFTHVHRLSVAGSVGIAFFQYGVAKLFSPNSLRELEVVGAPPRPGEPEMQRMAGRNLTWTGQEAVALMGLSSLELSGVTYMLALPHAIRGLPPGLKHLSLKSVMLGNPGSWTRSSPLTQLNVINDFLPSGATDWDRWNMMRDSSDAFRTLLGMYHGTLQSISYSTSQVQDTFSDHVDWRCPSLPRLRFLYTDGVQYVPDSLGLMFARCPQLEEWTVYQRDPSWLLKEFGRWIDHIPPTLNKMTFSGGVLREMGDGERRYNSVDSSIIELVRDEGKRRGVEIKFAQPAGGESMA